MSMVNFWAALATKARADSTLVSLTSHTAADKRIIRGRKPGKGKYPCLYFNEVDTKPAIEDSATVWKTTIVEFEAVATTDIAVMRIVDRLVDLLDQPAAAAPAQFWNITTVAGKIRNNMTRLVQRTRPEFDQDTDAYSQKVTATFRWHDLA